MDGSDGSMTKWMWVMENEACQFYDMGILAQFLKIMKNPHESALIPTFIH